MFNTPVAWEAMTDAEARSRVARLRRCAATSKNVYGAFAPWQHLSTGVTELDRLLSRAGVGSISSSHNTKNDIHTSGKGARDTGSGEAGGGCCGLPVGGLHEFYGPPLAGKSFLLRRLAVAYTRRMTAFRQWCMDEWERDQTWLTVAHEAERESHAVHRTSSQVDAGSLEPETASQSATTSADTHTRTAALRDWDLYICVVRGISPASSATCGASSDGAALSAEILAWQETIMDTFPAYTSRSPSSNEKGNRRNADTGDASLRLRSQQQLQSDYAADHCHLCEVATPNELLNFLHRLVRSSAGDADTCSANKTDPAAAHVMSAKPHDPSDQVRADDNVSPRGEVKQSGQRKRARSGSPNTDISSSTSPHSLSTHFSSPSASQRLWDFQRQRLLLIDGLDQLWLHPSFGTHSGTHTGHVFASELHRLLRCFLAPQPSTTTTSNFANSLARDATTRTHPSTLYSTVVLTNGCHSGSYSMHTPAQLQARLRTPSAAPPVHEKSGEASARFVAALPRPSGNPVWLLAPDTRCFVEPAHPGLVSFPSSPSAAEFPTHASAQSTGGGWQSGAPAASSAQSRLRDTMAGPPRTTFSTAVSSTATTKTTPMPCAVAVDAFVTVVQGGSQVCATWMRRCEEESDE